MNLELYFLEKRTLTPTAESNFILMKRSEMI
jgi:hypothetical protein